MCCSCPATAKLFPRRSTFAHDSRHRITLNLPLLSSPMDTVTESAMAIALAQQGGLGVIHKNMSIDRQTKEVDMVKRSANGIISDPVTLPPTATVAQAQEVMEKHNVSGVPITQARRPPGRDSDSPRSSLSGTDRIAHLGGHDVRQSGDGDGESNA